MARRSGHKSSRSIDRRAFLKGLGGSMLALPLARTVLAEEGAPLPKRLILVMQNNGTQQANFWPGDGFRSPILEPILRYPNLAAKTNLVKGIQMTTDVNGTDGNQHDVGFIRMFTGHKVIPIARHPWGGGPSIDQIVARTWGIESLTLAVHASVTEPRPKPGFDHRKSFSYVAAGQHKVPIVDPFLAYQKLYGEDGFASSRGTLSPAIRQRLQLRKSVLDAVAGNIGEVSSRLGPKEQAKLDLHLTSIREMERQLSDTLNNEAVPLNDAACRTSTPRNFTAINPRLLISSDEAIPEMVGNMVDIAATSLACPLTRIATLQLGFGGGKWRFAWEGINMNCHDDVAHLDTSDNGSGAINTERLIKMNRWYAAQVARLALKLDAVPEGDGTVLDNTLIVWANELGRGDHSMRNIPVVMIGKAGGGLPVGKRLIDEGQQVFNRVGCSILNLMGIESTGFGDQMDCGNLRGLLG